MEIANDDIQKAISLVARRMYARFPWLEGRFDSEVMSAAGYGVLDAVRCYNPKKCDIEGVVGWLVYSGERRAITTLASNEINLIKKTGSRKRLPRLLNVTDVFDSDHCSMDYFSKTGLDLYAPIRWDELMGHHPRDCWMTRQFRSLYPMLSGFERKVLEHRCKGVPYEDIRGMIYKRNGKRPTFKDIDNALRRIKEKARGVRHGKRPGLRTMRAS